MAQLRRTLVAALLFAGCSYYTPLEYNPPEGAVDVAAAIGSGPISVESFRDARAGQPNVIGALRDPAVIPVYTLRTEYPIPDLVTKAFRDGLAVRGQLSSDVPGDLVLTGNLVELSAGGYGRLAADAVVEVLVADANNGVVVFSNTYRSTRRTGFIISTLGTARNNMEALAREVLSDVVDQCLDDSRLLALLDADADPGETTIQ